MIPCFLTLFPLATKQGQFLSHKKTTTIRSIVLTRQFHTEFQFFGKNTSHLKIPKLEPLYPHTKFLPNIDIVW